MLMGIEATIKLLINKKISFEINDRFDDISNLGICDLDGKVVYKQLIKFGELPPRLNFSVEGLDTGVYYILVHGLNNMITRKLTIT